MRAAFANAGLRVKLFHLMGATSKMVLDKIGRLGPGAYVLTLPKYTAAAEFIGLHSIAIIIEPNSRCTILDSNCAIGWCSFDELPATLGRLFTEYTGLDYSDDFNGQPPSGWQQLGNIFADRANPPMEVKSVFELIEITEGSL
jgi:hypothetical protein